MKTLLLMRHAKSSWSNRHMSDYERPLNERGLATAPRVGAMLRDMGLTPGALIASSAERTRATAELVAEASGYTGEIELHDSLYHGTPVDYLSILNSLPESVTSALLIGHNPCLEDLIFMLTGEVEEMPTAAVAQLGLPIESWAEFSPRTEAVLENLWRPREIEA